MKSEFTQVLTSNKMFMNTNTGVERGEWRGRREREESR